MNYIYISIIILLLAGGFYFLTQTDLLGRDSAMQSPDKNITVVEEEEAELTYHPEVSLQALSQKEFDGRDLTLGNVLSTNSAYTQYYITYKSADLIISGIMNVPSGEGPFPVLILGHGYIDPAVYTVGRGLRREQDYYARNGFLVIHPDYRNHGNSTKVENSEESFRLGYTEDVINAIYAVRQSELGFFDKQNIGMMGHSMGGGVAMQLLVSRPDLVRAVSLYAPVSSDAYDNFEKWTRTRAEIAQSILDTHGSPEQNPTFWQNISPINFIENITSPIIVHHGTSDESVPIEWSDEFVAEMEGADKDITYYVYQNEAHEFGPQWTTFMQRNVEFFNGHLR